MELYEMLFQRLTGSEALSASVTQFANRPAIFYQRPPSADNPKWANRQYPRIDYNIDMQENPARNTSGVLSINVWCDAEFGDEPEEIEYKIRHLLHACFAQADDYAYCFAWVRSDSFEVKNEKEQDVRTIGTTLIFDIMACPSQQTLYPDPIKAMNDWTKSILPTAIVIGEDTINGWIVPSRTNPVIYWRITGQSVKEKHFSYTWLNIALEGHVYARNSSDRLYNLTLLNTAMALAGHIPMEDTSPLFIKDFSFKPHFAYLSQGQMSVNGYFGILQPFMTQPVEPKLNHINIPREIIDGDMRVDAEDGSSGFVFPYEVADADTNPQPL